MLPVQTW